MTAQGRCEFLYDLIESVEDMTTNIADREVIEPDFAIVRELAEQLSEELRALTE